MSSVEFLEAQIREYTRIKSQCTSEEGRRAYQRAIETLTKELRVLDEKQTRLRK